MKTIKQLTNYKFLNIKEVCDPEFHVNRYQFAERRGVNSVAFVCFDQESEQFLLNKELKPPIGKYILGAFGGSFDKNKNPSDIVIDEVKEEAGFVVAPDDVEFVGKVLVSTQMNQYCFLYLVFVDKKNQREREPENNVEKLASTEWNSLDNTMIYQLEDWKPVTIIAMAQARNII